MALDSGNVWDFNCPQYVDFQSAANDSADSYFDIDHESDQTGNVSNDLFCEPHKSAGLKSTGKKPVSEKKIEGLGTPAIQRAKRKPLSVIQAHDANQRNDYELRLTPYRIERPKSYCSAYVADYKEPPSQAKPANKYYLRMTPARKRKTKSCFTFHDTDLKELRKCAGVHTCDEDANDSSEIKSEELPASDGREVHVDHRSTLPVVDTPPKRKSNFSKRTTSPLSEMFPIKRAKLVSPQLQMPQKKRLSNRLRFKSTEEQELMKIKQRRSELAQQRLKNRAYMSKAINADFSRKVSNSIVAQPTVIQPFHFKTDERIKDARRAEEYKHVDFSSILRRQSPKTLKSKPSLTKFQPFHFATDKRKIQQDPKVEDQGARKIMTMGRSMPQSPNLKAIKRNRPVVALSRQQEEEQEVQEMKKFKFQAKDFDPALFATVSLPRVYTKPSTKPEGIELATEKRFKSKEVKKVAEEKFEFHAQPVPKQILSAPTGLKPKTTVPLTEPKSPVFALKLRSQKWKEHPSILDETTDHQVSLFKAQPVPQFKAPAPVKIAKRCTIMEPFSFDKKDQERAYLKDQKVSEEIKKQKSACSFRAQPIPDLTCISGLPKKDTKPVTKPEPFTLQIDKLAVQKIDKWQKEIENQLVHERQAALFKANPAVVTKRPPFVPEKSAKPLTVSNTFQLETEKRAEERAKYEEHVEAIGAENRAQLLLLKEEKEKKEKEEIALLRKESVHKANPVRHYKPIAIKPSEKPLTEPNSPQFATSLRIKQRL